MDIFFKKKIKDGGRNLELELLHLLRRKFNVRAQLRVGQFKQTHLLKKIRRDIARIKFYLLKNR